MFDKTITVHNIIRNDNEEKLHSTVLEGVYFLKDDSVTLASPGTVKSDVVTAIIPKKLVRTNRQYIESYKFDKLKDVERDKYFTLRQGDFLSLGDVTGDVTSINEYRNQTGNAYSISAFTDYDLGGLPNFEVYAH